MAEITPSHQKLSTADVVWSSNSITASRSARALLFENRGLLLALPADSVSEVIEAPRVTDVPGSPAWFNGVCVYRSQPVPVVDVARYLQAGTADLTFNRGIVVRVASSSYLLVADRILNLCNLRLQTTNKCIQVFTAPRTTRNTV